MARRRRNPGSLEQLAAYSYPGSAPPPRPRGRKNPGPKGAAKTGALMRALVRREGLYSRGRIRGAGVLSKHYALGKAIGRRYKVLHNPAAAKGRGKGRALWAAMLRRERVQMAREGFPQGDRSPSYMRWYRANLGRAQAMGRRERVYGVKFDTYAPAPRARRRRRKNPLPALAGFMSQNPRRKAKTMARRRRRRRSAAQRAAFRRMIAGLRRFKARVGKKSRRRRRRNPSRGASNMARRRHRSRRRRAALIMVNPRRRRRRIRRNPRRVRHHRRRRNPGGGAGIKGAMRSVFMAGVPALAGGFVANYIDAKFLSDKSTIVRILAKVAQAGVAGMIFRRRPVVAYATMGAILGSVGGDFGTRLAGGAVVGAAPAAKAAGVSALITEDPRAMGVLVQSMQGMGYQIDSNVSLGDMSPLPAGTYQDVNLG